MRFLISCFLMLMATGQLSCSQDREPQRQIIVGDAYSFYSNTLKEEQTYLVSLPPSYGAGNSSKAYPVIYLLDGYEAQFRSVSAAVLSNNVLGSRVPEAIVVGLPSNNRNRDYLPVHSTTGYQGNYEKRLEVSGGGEAYREFLETELLPEIQRRYVTNGHRILVGHSFGGHFALYDLMSDDRLFQSYITIDPIAWVGDWYLVDKAKQLQSPAKEFAGSLYASRVPHDDNPRRAASIISIVRNIEEKLGATFYVKLDHFENENHQSVQPISYYEGLRFIFEGYEPPDIETSARNPEALVAHYKQFSSKTGAQYLPDEVYVNAVAFNALGYYKLTENAHTLYQLNVENFPKSVSAWANLGYYFDTVGQPDQAREAYSRALELNPNSSFARRRLEALDD